MRFGLTSLLLGILLLGPSARADEIGDAQSTIRSQLEAIGKGEAAAAYGYAAPGIQKIFPEADAFIAMVKTSYPPLVGYKSFVFGEAKPVDGGFAQRVKIVDADGTPWDGLYTLEKQADGSFKISGCVLLKTPGVPV